MCPFMSLPPEGEGGAPAPEGGCLHKHGVKGETPNVLHHPPSALRAPSPSGGRLFGSYANALPLEMTGVSAPGQSSGGTNM